jgi:hypothetical protein
MSAVAELAADAAVIAGMGHNQPPPSPFDLISEHIGGLLDEAHNWADGTTVTTQAQADEASRLIDDLRKAAKAAEDAQAGEQQVHDDAIAEIRTRYRPLIQAPNTKNPGRIWKAIDALKACVKPYLDRLEAERQEAARKAREEAEAAAAKAAEAHRAAQASDLAAQEAAEKLVAAAEQAAADAKRIENSRTQARGGERAMGLRTVYAAVMTDRKAALLHYLTHRPDDIVNLLQGLADRDVHEGKRQIPGFTVEQRTAL